MVSRRSTSVSILVALAALLVGLSGCSLFTATGTVFGTVYDSTAGGAGLAGVLVSVVGTTYTATTDSYGEFSVKAPVGTSTLRFQKAGYSFTDLAVEVERGIDAETLVSIVAYQPLTAGQYRVVLTWGEYPYDIDSHLVLPGGEEVYFADQEASDLSANLDWDDTSSYGPETVSILTVNPGTYYYYVYNWSGTPEMGAASNAVVQVYDSSGLIETLRITEAPGASTSSQLYWRVFSFNGSTFTWINQMADSGY